jgi:Mn-dependent DtxR family transcriptional regulator
VAVVDSYADQVRQHAVRAVIGTHDRQKILTVVDIAEQLRDDVRAVNAATEALQRAGMATYAERGWTLTRRGKRAYPK